MNKLPRILLFDIETSPIMSYVWKTWQDNSLKILQPSQVMSVSWKWLNEDETYVKALPDYKGYKKGILDDEKLVKEIWNLFDEADILIGHHCKKFDIPKMLARFIYHDLQAPSSYQVVDTKAVASKYFKFDSNGLNNLGEYLGCGSKLSTGGFSLWDRCINGDLEAWETMKEYNKQDTVLLEQVYLKLRPFIQNHPSLSLISGTVDQSCPTCQSTDLERRGFAYTRTGSRQRFQCRVCHSWSSGPLKRSSNILMSPET